MEATPISTLKETFFLCFGQKNSNLCWEHREAETLSGTIPLAWSPTLHREKEQGDPREGALEKSPLEVILWESHGAFSSSPYSSSKSCLVNLLCRVGASTLGFPVADTTIHTWYPRGCVLCGTADHPLSRSLPATRVACGLKSMSRKEQQGHTRRRL